jgi:di/tricarboxylate transporter
MVSAFGKTTLGLTYSLVFGEALLSPAIPSVAARAGGIFFPLAKVGLVVGGRAWWGGWGGGERE